MSSINEFIAQVRSEGLMVTNRYSVEFTLPSKTKLNFPGLQKILLHSESIILPGINVSTTQAKTFGEFREMPYERTFEPIQMTFYVDNAMTVKMLFDDWINNSIQNMTTRKFNYYKEYTTDMNIHVFDKNEQQRYKVHLYECFPKNISSVQMDNNAKGEPMRIVVSMNYKNWDSSIMDATPTDDPLEQYINTQEVPDTYYTNFNTFQNNFNSFENSRNSLYSAESQSIGLGSIFT